MNLIHIGNRALQFKNSVQDKKRGKTLGSLHDLTQQSFKPRKAFIFNHKLLIHRSGEVTITVCAINEKLLSNKVRINIKTT